MSDRGHRYEAKPCLGRIEQSILCNEESATTRQIAQKNNLKLGVKWSGYGKSPKVQDN